MKVLVNLKIEKRRKENLGGGRARATEARKSMMTTMTTTMSKRSAGAIPKAGVAS